MTIATRRPNIIRRVGRALGEAYGIITPARAAWLDDDGSWQHHNDLLSGATTAGARRAFTTNADLVAMYGAIWACVRLRSRRLMRPRIYVVRMNKGGEPEEVPNHPGLEALNAINESMTGKQGRAYIGTLRLTWGKAYLIKRRNGLRVPVEFEFWPPDQVTVIPDKAKPWVPAAFKRILPNGSTETVAPIDVVWQRYFIDPRNPLNGLSPIGAVRVQVDTGMEAQRYNQRFFDNDTAPSRMFTVEEGGPAEVSRIEQELERKFKGTDNAHRAMVVEGGLKVVEGSAAMSQKDMQFAEQQSWNVEEVARVMETSPISIGSMSGSTFSNMEWIDKKDWSVVQDDLDDILAQFTEFMLWPDFGREFEFRADYSMIDALQADLKLRAEIDAIQLSSAKVVINELRQRDKEDPVPWGDTPIVNVAILGPLDYRSAAERDAARAKLALAAGAGSTKPPTEPKPPRATRAVDGAPDMPEPIDASQERLATGWERRLRKELRLIIAQIEANWDA